MKPKSQMLLALAWVILCVLRIGSRWDELYWFLFSISHEDVRNLYSIPPERVWHASDAMWWLLGLIFWTGVFVVATLGLIKTRRLKNQKEGEQVGDGDAEEAV